MDSIIKTATKAKIQILIHDDFLLESIISEQKVPNLFI